MKGIKHVNVGTVGHVDHERVLYYTGKPSYLEIPGGWSGNNAYIQCTPNPFAPEWIYWMDGLVIVAGRVVHDAKIYGVENPSGQGDFDPGYSPMIVNPKGKHYYTQSENRLQDQKSHHLLNEFIAQSEVGYFSTQTRLARLERNNKRLEEDRLLVIPSKQQIRSAIWFVNLPQYIGSLHGRPNTIAIESDFAEAEAILERIGLLSPRGM